MVANVGIKPMNNVGKAIKKMDKANRRLRPIKSPKCAITKPPKGLKKYPAAKIP